MTATAVVGSAAEDTTPSEREAPQRFAWWHPRSADLGRHKARREEHARRNDIWARSPAQEEAPVIPRPLPPPSASCVFAVLDGPVFAPVDPPMCLAPYMSESCTCIQENPRRANTKPYNAYEAYKAGTTLQGVLDLGAKKSDLAHDLARKLPFARLLGGRRRRV